MIVKSAAVLCLASLLLTGCGVTTAEEPPQSFESTRQELLWPCDGGSEWIRRWYSDSSRTNEIGREDCYCDGSLYQYGTTSGYYSQTRVGYCFN